MRLHRPRLVVTSRPLRYVFILGFVVALGVPTPAGADVVTFAGLNGGIQAPMTPYREGSFRVTPVTRDTWFEGQLVGNPVPNVFARPLADPKRSVLMLTRAETFTFSALDLSSNFGASDVTIEGFLGSSSVFTQTQSPDSPGYDFQTIASLAPATIIDRLRITVDPISALSINIDNILLSGSELIDFSGLNGAIQSPFSLYNQGAFTVNPLTRDDWLEGQLVGNPVPNIFTRTPGVIEITRTGTFAFGSLEYSSNFGASTYAFEGYLNGALVAAQTGSASSPGYDFQTLNGFPSQTIDRLFLTVEQLDALSVNIDNINLARVDPTVPEPAAVVLLATAWVAKAVHARRRRDEQTD
jgi:hypothetical protein